jgi:hypothetical protein
VREGEQTYKIHGVIKPFLVISMSSSLRSKWSSLIPLPQNSYLILYKKSFSLPKVGKK